MPPIQSGGDGCAGRRPGLGRDLAFRELDDSPAFGGPANGQRSFRHAAYGDPACLNDTARAEDALHDAAQPHPAEGKAANSKGPHRYGTGGQQSQGKASRRQQQSNGQYPQAHDPDGENAAHRHHACGHVADGEDALCPDQAVVFEMDVYQRPIYLYI